MKKYIVIPGLVGIFSASILFAQENADSLNQTETGDVTENTNDETLNINEWGYKDTDEIKVKEVGKDYVIISSPVVKDAVGMDINTYRIIYSTKPIDGKNVNIEDLKDKVIVLPEINGETVDLRLDGLKPGTTYYIAIEPQDTLGEPGAVSNQIEVTTASDQPEHDVANQDVLTNITYSFTGNTITVNWDAADNVSKVEVYIKKDTDKEFTKISEVNSNNSKVDLTVTEPGLYIVKLVPYDNQGNTLSDGYNVSVKVDSIKKEIKQTPKTGPATNLIILLILLSIVGYLFLKVYKRA